MLEPWWSDLHIHWISTGDFQLYPENLFYFLQSWLWKTKNQIWVVAKSGTTIPTHGLAWFPRWKLLKIVIFLKLVTIFPSIWWPPPHRLSTKLGPKFFRIQISRKTKTDLEWCQWYFRHLAKGLPPGPPGPVFGVGWWPCQGLVLKISVKKTRSVNCQNCWAGQKNRGDKSARCCQCRQEPQWCLWGYKDDLMMIWWNRHVHVHRIYLGVS